MLDLLYKELFKSTPIPLVVTDVTGKISLVNDQAVAFLDNQAVVFDGLDFCDFIDRSFLKDYLREKSQLTFDEFLVLYKTEHRHWLKGKKGIAVYADIKAVTFELESQVYYIWTFDQVEISRRLTYDLNERVKEQLAILNVIEVCFQHADIREALHLCLQPIREGWQYPHLTEVCIRLNSGEVFCTPGFKITQWFLQSTIRSANTEYGSLELCYMQEVPPYGGGIFLYEEQRLIGILSKLLGIFLEHWYANKRTVEAVVTTQEKERYQIGMDLHDNVQQILTAASLHANLLKTEATGNLMPALIEKIKDYLSQAIDELRRVSQQLAPSVDPLVPLSEKFRSLANSMSINGELSVSIEIDSQIELDESIQLHFYRIVQEQLTNIIKYAGATDVVITIKKNQKTVVLTIDDKGNGFAINQQKTGTGLQNIKRRAEFMNGTSHIISRPGHGTSLMVEIPLDYLPFNAGVRPVQ